MSPGHGFGTKPEPMGFQLQLRAFAPVVHQSIQKSQKIKRNIRKYKAPKDEIINNIICILLNLLISNLTSWFQGGGGKVCL